MRRTPRVAYVEDDIRKRLDIQFGRDKLYEIIDTLLGRQALILRKLYFEEEKASNIAKYFNVSLCRIRQLEKKALYRLGVPPRIKVISRYFLSEEELVYLEKSKHKNEKEYEKNRIEFQKKNDRKHAYEAYDDFIQYLKKFLEKIEKKINKKTDDPIPNFVKMEIRKLDVVEPYLSVPLDRMMIISDDVYFSWLHRKLNHFLTRVAPLN